MSEESLDIKSKHTTKFCKFQRLVKMNSRGNNLKSPVLDPVCIILQTGFIGILCFYLLSL